MASADRNPLDSSDEETTDKSTPDSKTENEPPVVTAAPEGEEDRLQVKACECSSCSHWINSADWCPTSILKFENSSEKCTRKEKKAQPLLQTDEQSVQNLKIKTYKPDNLTKTKIQMQKVFKILVHGVIIPAPVDKSTETYFNEEIQVALAALNYRYTLPIQAFAWPAIFRQMNVFLIGSQKSGKTLAYLPAVCTLYKTVQEKHDGLTKYKGPIVVIICASSKQCEEVLDLIKTMYDKSNASVRPKIAIVSYPVSRVPYTDILITIPESLIHCLKERIFNMKRVCHIILEDASTLLKNHEDAIYNILEVTNEMLEHRAFNTQVQLIATSEKWSNDLKNLMRKLFVTPLICIGNNLEAALYGNIKFEIKFLMSSQKLSYLEGVLKNKYHLYKTIVICEQSEITDVTKWLVRNGIETVALSDTSSREEIDENENEWIFTPNGRNKVLLCTDFVFDSMLNVSDAMWLIHYSFPPTWTRFTKRFSALSAHYKSPLDSNEDSVECKSFIMIDESCEQQMAKILNLMSRLSKDLPSNYQKYAEGFREKTELAKIDNKVSICDALKLFGKCPDSLCDTRHLVSKAVDVSENLPQCGKIVFKILNMKDVTRFTVQIISHIDMSDREHKINDDNLKKPLVYDADEEKKRPESIVIGNFYAHCDYTTEGEVYTLCHVVKIEREGVTVALINGLSLQTLKNKLFEVPSRIRIADVILCNLVPPFCDKSFSGRSFYVTKTSLENVRYKEKLLTGTIYLQLDKTLWLHDVVHMFDVDGTNVIRFNLTKHIINLNVVEPYKSQISSLHKLCKKCDIVLPTYSKRVVKAPVKKKEVEPQTAFLDDNVNEVILSSAVSPDEFYVRLTKFQPLLENLEKDILVLVQNEVLHKNLKIEIGKYYICPDPREETYSRVKLLNVENDKALCFYVDYGDEAVVDIKKLKILPSKLLTKLPFQAIQCRLYGLCPAFGEWDDDTTDVLYKYMMEPESDIFRSLFVVSQGKDEGDMVRSKVKYSVLLKDGYGDKNVLINQLLLDCGFAASIFDKLDDFEIPTPQVVEDSDDSGDSNVEGHPEEENVEIEADDAKTLPCNEDELEMFNAEKFLELLGLPNLQQLQQRQQRMERAIESRPKQEKTEINSSEIGSEPDCLTPEVYWSQTDKIVRLKIKLVDVQQYKATVFQKRVFTFSTNLNEKNYEVKFTLHKPAQLGKHSASGQEVRVILNKVESVEWPQLTSGKKKLRYIHYELSDREEKEPKKKILQLDITDSESDRDGDDMPMYVVSSDMESDFDEDIPSSSDSS